MTHLQKIVIAAKKIKKLHPSKKWTDCIKAASKQIKPAAKKAVKKKSVGKIVRKKAAVKKAAPKKHTSSLTAAQHKKHIHEALEKKLSSLFLRREKAKKVTDKRKISKEILVVKRKIITINSL
jgi:glutamate 5-kinase